MSIWPGLNLSTIGRKRCEKNGEWRMENEESSVRSADRKEIVMHGDGLYKEIYLNELRPGRFQPRRTFEAVKLLELAESIKRQGVMDPPVV
ncbi:MAG: ParB N-terminal domain-containing protein, partial [Anaerolineae bacterium]|nr:ParB N-terminal domain-containing protein [Anaerolineae bacterium]